MRSFTKESPCGSPKQLNPLHHPSLCLQPRTELLPMLWRHHWKTKQMYAVLNCWGVRQGAACIGAQCAVLMSSMNSELIDK